MLMDRIALASRSLRPHRLLLWFLLLFALSALAWPAVAVPVTGTQATLVNPQSGDIISNSTLLQTQTYILNGSCHLTDSIGIVVYNNSQLRPQDVETTIDPTQVTIKNGSWEAIYTPKPGVSGLRYIVVTPMANGIPGKFVDLSGTAINAVAFSLDNGTAKPVGALELTPENALSNVFVGYGVVLNDNTKPYSIPIILRAAPRTGKILYKYLLSETHTTSRPADSFTNSGSGSINDGTFAITANDAARIFQIGTQTGVAEGLTTVHVQYEDATAFDGTGFLAGDTYNRSFILDQKLPSVNVPAAFSFPAPNTVRLTGTVQDTPRNVGNPVSGISSVEVMVSRATKKDGTAANDNIQVVPAKLQYGDKPGDPVVWAADLTIATDPNDTGLYDFSIIITDNAGNYTVDPGSVTNYPIDRKAPAASITSPANGAVVSGSTVNIGLSASDTADGTVAASGLDTYELDDTVTVGMKTYTVVLDSTAKSGTHTPPATFSWDTSKAGDGSHVLTLTVTDAQKNSTTSASVTVSVVNQPPVVTISAPGNGIYEKADFHITGTVTSADPGTTWTIFDNNAPIHGPISISTPVDFLYPVAGKDGVHSLKITATDTGGHTAQSDTHLVVVDTIPPTATFLSPTSSFVHGIVHVSASINDNNPSQNPNSWTLYYTDPGNTNHTISIGTGASVSGDFDTTSLTDGATYTLKIDATDAAGNSSAPAVTKAVTVLQNGPVINFTTPADGASVKGDNVTLSGTITGADPGTTWVIKDGATVIASGTGASLGGSPFTGTWHTFTPTDLTGSHSITVTAEDTAGNVTSVSKNLFVDNNVPTATFSMPSSGAIVTNPVAIRGAITNDADAANFTWNITDTYNGNTTTLVANKTGALVAYDWTVPGGQDGAHVLKITGQNRAGTPITPPSLSITVDNTAPTAALTAPATDGMYFNANFSITGTITEDNLQSWQITDNGVNIPGATGSTNAVSFTYPVAGKDGPHTFVINALDKVGKTGQSNARTVIVDTTPPVITIVAPNTPSFVGAAVASVKDANPGSSVIFYFVVSGVSVGQPPDPAGNVPASQRATVTVALTNGSASAAVPGTYDDGVTLIAPGTKLDIYAKTIDLALNTSITPVPVTATIPQSGNSQPVTIDNVLLGTSNAVQQSGVFYLSNTATIVGTVKITNFAPSGWSLTATNNKTGAVIAIVTGSNQPVNAPPFTLANWDTKSGPQGRVPDGTYTLTLTATDAGNVVYTTSAVVVVDNTFKDFAIDVAPEFPPDLVKGKISVVGVINEDVDEQNPVTWQVYVGSTPPAPGQKPDGQGLNIAFPLDTTDKQTFPKDDTYTVHVKATDLSGNTFTADKTFTVDNTAPTSTITPLPAFVKGSVMISGAIIELHLSKWQITDNGVDILDATGTTNSVTYTWNTVGKDGPHTLAIRATDVLGNVGTTASPVAVIVDNTNPAPVLSTPAAPDPNHRIVVAGTVPISGAFNDANPSTYSIVATKGDGSSPSTIFSGTTKSNDISYNWDTTTVTNGDYNLYITATDAAGNIGTSNLAYITVNNISVSGGLNLIHPTVGYDEFGNSYSDQERRNQQTEYVGGPSVTGFEVQSDLQNFRSWNLAELFNNTVLKKPQTGIAPNQFDGNYTTPADEGRHQFTLTATGTDNNPSPPINRDIVLDTKEPSVQILAPLGKPYTISSGSLLTFVFRINNPGLTMDTVQAPILRIPKVVDMAGRTTVAYNVPKVLLAVHDVTANQDITSIPWDLLTALTKPDINSENGAATIEGDQIHGYTITWQLRITPRTYAFGHQFKYTLDGVQDVAQNAAAKKTFLFTVNIN